MLGFGLSGDELRCSSRHPANNKTLKPASTRIDVDKDRVRNSHSFQQDCSPRQKAIILPNEFVKTAETDLVSCSEE
jgi:hypothetical protein